MYTPQPLILCYHAVSGVWPSTLAVPPDLLARHVEHLRRRGYRGFTLTELERRRAVGALPERAVAVTFDDGYLSTLEAVPILARAGFPGTVFVVSRFVDSGELLRWPGVDHWCDTPHASELRPLRWPELERVLEAGWEVGSHTVSHPRLPALRDEELLAELEESRRTIVARLGACETVAYPFGLADERVARAAERAGYQAGVTLTGAHVVDSVFLRSRVGLYPADDGLRMRAKLSPALTALRRTRLAAAAEAARTRLRR